MHVQLNYVVLFCLKIMENAEINNIIKIVGLQYKKSYDDAESLKSLRYGKIMIMTDQVCSVLNLCDNLRPNANMFVCTEMTCTALFL